jgi:hypothetical protein
MSGALKLTDRQAKSLAACALCSRPLAREYFGEQDEAGAARETAR